MGIILVSATPYKLKVFLEMPISLSMNAIGKEIDNTNFIIDNKDGLPIIYNKAIKKYENKEIILLFAHHDILIEDGFLSNKLINSQFDIIGLAGTSQKPSLYTQPILWNRTPVRCHSGAVAHTDGENIWMTSYGPFRRNCIIVDGLFIAVKLQKIIDAGIRFDESFDFHFYDLDFCYQCHEAGLSIGTEPIWVVHSGLGDSFRSEAFERNQKLFIEKWGK